MSPGDIARIFSLLKGGAIQGLDRDGADVRIRVHLPELSRLSNPESESEHFFCTLKNCREFFLQPFKNADTLLRSFDEIVRLKLCINTSESVGYKVKVFCSHKGAETGATLHIGCEEFWVYNDNFDQLGIAELTDLRSRANK